MDQELAKELIACVRSWSIENSYTAGDFEKPQHHECCICGEKWPPRIPEAHKPDCLLARAYAATGQEPPVVRVKDLGS